MKRRLNYYLNCSASFNPIMVSAICSGDIHPHPGPVPHSTSTSTRKQTPHSFCPDLIAVTETWLKPHILDSEILPGLDFSIHRRDRKNKTGGGVMLAVKNSIQTLHRKDLEGDVEIVLCELFYRPPNSNLDHLKELKKSLHHASQFNFDQIIICGILICLILIGLLALHCLPNHCTTTLLNLSKTITCSSWLTFQRETTTFLT